MRAGAGSWACLVLTVVPAYCVAEDAPSGNTHFTDSADLSLWGDPKDAPTAVFGGAAPVMMAAASDDQIDHSHHMAAASGDGMDHSMHMATSATDPQAGHVHHTHQAGMWMFEYRFMRMYQEGMLDGAKNVSPESLLFNPGYTDIDGNSLDNAPTEMTMDMHMFMGMYSPNDWLTYMVMFNYLANEMDMIMQMMPGDPIESMHMESSGLGDTQIGAMINLDRYVLLDRLIMYNPVFSAMLSLPTGSIDEKDDMGDLLPYDMQLGTGSYDLETAFSVSTSLGNVDLGGEASYLWRTCDNEQNYRWGDSYGLKGWAKYRMPWGTTARAILDYRNSDEIEGRDERSNENTDYYGGMRTDLGVGINHTFGFGLGLDFQFAVPVHQMLNGIQMETDWLLEAAVQWMIH